MVQLPNIIAQLGLIKLFKQCFATYRLEGNIVDGEDVEVGQVVHHDVEQVSPSVCEAHFLEIVVKWIQSKHIEMSFSPGELVDYEVPSLSINSFLMGLKLLLIDLK